MFTQVLSAAIYGVDARIVRVEADVSDGLPSFSMVGYVSDQVNEAQDRVVTDVSNFCLSLPPKRVTINLAPADIRKEGPRFDLPIAAAVLCAAGRIAPSALKDTMILGELGLNGAVCPVSGVLPSVLAARDCGCRVCILPFDNLTEGRNVQGIRIVGLSALEELSAYCCDPEGYVQREPGRESGEAGERRGDFADIHGQEPVKRAAVLSVAGFHNLLMIGPPGSGKTMAASRLPGLMPDMTDEESLEVTKIYSVAGLLPGQTSLLTERPFRSPHHTISPQALAGGGRFPRPGEITLAHRGVLFLDEFPEFSRTSLEILRQPLEDKRIVISRSQGTVAFPADFILVAAMNPCPCGYYPDMNRCTCSPGQISSYIHKISQPLLDRMELCVEAPALTYEELGRPGDGMDTETLKGQAADAFAIQKKRYREERFFYNSQLGAGDLKRYCPMSADAEDVLMRMYDKLGLSARACHRLIKVARTAADLDRSDRIGKKHMMEACSYRNAGEKIWHI